MLKVNHSILMLLKIFQVSKYKQTQGVILCQLTLLHAGSKTTYSTQGGAYIHPLGILLQRSLKCTIIYANSYTSNLSNLWVIEKESSSLSQKMWSWRRKKNLWREMRRKNSAVSKHFFKSRQIFLSENKTYNP